MKVAICNSINNSNISTKHNYAVYRAILEHNGIEYVAVDINKPNIWETCRKSDAFIYPWNHENNEEQISLSIIPIIEKHLSVKCYPNYDTCWHYDDKIKQYYL